MAMQSDAGATISFSPHIIIVWLLFENGVYRPPMYLRPASILLSTCMGAATIYSEIVAHFSLVRDHSVLVQVWLLFESGI